MNARHERLQTRSDELVSTAKRIKVLSAIAWPQSEATRFLDSWRSKNPVLPAIREAKAVSKKRRKTLERLIKETDPQDPVDGFIGRTAESYRLAAELVGNIGTPTFMDTSRALYGDTGGHMAGSALSHLEVANRLLESTRELSDAAPVREGDYCIPAAVVVKELKKRWRGFFTPPIRVIADADLAAKAAASANRVRIRSGTSFTEQDIEQLSAHEIGVHSLTSRNGRAQAPVAALGLGAPRTTATQEGLATFAELVTGSIDLARLRRIALRIIALHHAESGADFVQVFEELLEHGEPEGEAVRTAMRIFRGGNPQGGVVFTKDVVYLKGLFAVHTFLRKAFIDRRLELVGRLFCGRLTLQDAVGLEEAFEDGTIAVPARLPPWAANQPTLAAFLAVSALTDHVDLGGVGLDEIGRSL